MYDNHNFKRSTEMESPENIIEGIRSGSGFRIGLEHFGTTAEPAEKLTAL
jgi:hypothetical protein